MGQEKIYENRIKKYIESIGGWQVKFFANSMTKKGVPDILACVYGHFVAIETKAPTGKPSEIQIYQCKKIREAGGIAVIAYPSAWEKLKKILDDLQFIELDHEDIPLILK
jgi:Holliday junction resolvase